MRKFSFIVIISLMSSFLLFSESDRDEEKTDDLFNERVQFAMSNPDYMVTAGDMYLLSYAAGSSYVNYSIPVDNTYEIKVANLATINGKGKTFLRLKKEVEAIVNRNYPMGGVRFVLTQPALFNVFVKGEVNAARTENAWAMTRLGEVFEKDLTDYSSRRSVTIVSKEGKKNVYDLYKCYAEGDFSQNPYLRPEDTIIVNRYDRKVSVSGAVERPGTYELLPGEQINELIKIYGNGLRSRADMSCVELSRSEDITDSANHIIYLEEKDVSANFTLLDRDSVYIRSFDELRPVIFIEGAIIVSQDSAELISSNRRAVVFEKNEDYVFFVRRNKDLFTESSDLENAYILRGNSKIPLNLQVILYDNEFVSGLSPEKYDTLIVPFKQSFVTVAGAVNKPGRYPYIPDRTWDYYIGLAGGFDKTQNLGEVINIRDMNNRKVSKNGFITPESTITAVTNAPTYYFSIYAPVVTTLLSAVSTIFTIIAVTR